MSGELVTPPYLTFVVTGRNDDFGGDFNARFFGALQFNRQHLRDAGIAHEFVFVEWRPLPQKPYLASVLGDAFPDLPGSTIRSFVVDPAYHDALSLNPKLQFQEFIAKNVGIRRARGQFVLTTNTDIYLGRGTVEFLAAQSLSPGVLYRAARHDLRRDSDVASMTWEFLHDERNWDVVNHIKPPWFTNASGDFLLLDRVTYQELRGFNEVYRIAKIHMDSNFCVKAHASGVSLVDIEAPVFHVGHGTLNAQMDSYRDRPADAPWGDIRWNSTVLYENGPEWGLGDAPQRDLDGRTTYLAFDWRAVAPMVQLNRVVSPAREDTASPAAPRG
jgi:hypothetical protein